MRSPDPELCEIILTPPGRRMVLRSDLFRRDQLLNPRYDPPQVALLCDHLRTHSGAAVDCGANIGIFTLAMARHAGWVHAFEPQPLLACMCAGSVALNGYQNVTVHHCLLGEAEALETGDVFDYRQAQDFGRAEFGAPTGDEHCPAPIGRGGPLALHPLDAVVFDLTSVIKIDVEGMELAVLKGATRLITASKPLMLVEWTKSDRTALRNYIVDDLGYSIDATTFQDDWVCRPR